MKFKDLMNDILNEKRVDQITVLVSQIVNIVIKMRKVVEKEKLKLSEEGRDAINDITYFAKLFQQEVEKAMDEKIKK